MAYQSLPMLGLHCLRNLSHLDSGGGRAAEMKAPPPLRNYDCRRRQLDAMQERPASGYLRVGCQNVEARKKGKKARGEATVGLGIGAMR